MFKRGRAVRPRPPIEASSPQSQRVSRLRGLLPSLFGLGQDAPNGRDALRSRRDALIGSQDGRPTRFMAITGQALRGRAAARPYRGNGFLWESGGVGGLFGRMAPSSSRCNSLSTRRAARSRRGSSGPVAATYGPVVATYRPGAGTYESDAAAYGLGAATYRPGAAISGSDAAISGSVTAT